MKIKKSIPPTSTHWNHNIAIVPTDQNHRYKMICRECNDAYVRWANETEYVYVTGYYTDANIRITGRQLREKQQTDPRYWEILRAQGIPVLANGKLDEDALGI